MSWKARHTTAAHAAFVGELLREQDLQVAHRALLGVVATGIAIEAGASLRRHAHVVRGFVQHGMQRRIGRREQRIAAQAGLVSAQ